jgi:hypothetical protein
MPSTYAGLEGLDASGDQGPPVADVDNEEYFEQKETDRETHRLRPRN